ncbi:putative RNA polymerase II subunit A C-terminal domain phosphatase SSU72-like protein, partial [Naja naja]
KRGFSVRSFGTGTHVKLPGPAPDKPNVYDFKTTYDQMYSDLLRKDKELYPCGRAFQNPALCSFPRNNWLLDSGQVLVFPGLNSRCFTL